MDNSEEKKSKLPSIEGYQIEGPLSRTKSTVSFKATVESNRADVQITLLTGESYRTSLKPYLDESFPKITKTLKLVEHPNVIPLLDSGYVKEMPFTVIPYYATGSLKQFVGTTRNWRDVLTILLPVADALAYCHDHGIIHRDVKPQNVVINNQGDLCLTNFSLLEPTAANKLSVTLTGSGECSPAYIAPELWHGKCSPAVDQYSFGVMLYELLTATLPFDASNIVSLLVQQAAETITAPSTLVSGIPKDVDALIEKALASNPEARFASMRDLRTLMQELLSNSNQNQKDIQPGGTSAKPHKTSPTSKHEKKPPLSSVNVHTEQPHRESVVPQQENASKVNQPKEQKPKKNSNLLIFVMFSVLAAVILCAAIFLIGLLTDMGIITQLADKLSAWIDSEPMNALASEIILPTATLNALSPITGQPTQAVLDEPHYSIVVKEIGGATETQYYESSSPTNLPKIWVSSRNETVLGSKGDVYDLPIIVETFDSLGVRFRLLQNTAYLGNLHVFKSTEVELTETLDSCIHILRGAVFVATEGKPICVTTSLLPQDEIWVKGGEILVKVDRVNVEVWCLDGRCEITRNGESINTILPLTRSIYLNSGGYAERESNTQILFSLVDELKRFNLECNSCMSVQALYPPK